MLVLCESVLYWRAYMFKIYLTFLLLGISSCWAVNDSSVYNNKQIIVTMYLTSGAKKPFRVGTIIAQDTKFGLLLKPNLRMLEPGTYGFHVHENPRCGKNGRLAGGHLDPEKTGIHSGPYSSTGHLGDLPNIFVDKKGKAAIPLLAPRLKVADILNRSLIIHAKPDTYTTKYYTKGDARVVCGVVPKKSYRSRKPKGNPTIDVIH